MDFAEWTHYVLLIWQRPSTHRHSDMIKTNQEKEKNNILNQYTYLSLKCKYIILPSIQITIELMAVTLVLFPFAAICIHTAFLHIPNQFTTDAFRAAINIG